MDPKVLLEAFGKSGITASEGGKRSDITKLTLYELGLSGGENSRELREKLQRRLGLPRQLSAGALIEVLSTMMDSAELARITGEIKGESNGI